MTRLRKYPIKPCIRCGSENTKVYEWNNKFGSRRYYCNDCKQMFTIRLRPSKIKRRESITKVKPNTPTKTVQKPLCSLCHMPVCICVKLEKERKQKLLRERELEREIQRQNALQEKMKNALNLRSVLDVPCFFCIVEDRHCIESCEELENFLMRGLR